MRKFNVEVNGQAYEVLVEEVGCNATSPIQTPSVATPKKEVATPAKASAPVVASGEVVKAPMPGNINAVKVSKDATVKQGDVLLILEAMKMENEIVAPKDGKVSQILVAQGANVNTGDALIVIE